MKTRIFIAALMALAAGYLFAPRLAATSAWLLRRIAGLDMDGAGAFRQSWEPYRLIQPRTDIRLTVDVVSADNGDISAGFGLVLVDTARYTNLVLY